MSLPITENLTPFAYETLTVSTTALPFTASKYSPNGLQDGSPCVYAVATVETNTIRYREDGVAPTSSVGHLRSAGQVLTVSGVPAIRQMQLIRQGAADASVTVTYYKEGP